MNKQFVNIGTFFTNWLSLQKDPMGLPRLRRQPTIWRLLKILQSLLICCFLIPLALSIPPDYYQMTKFLYKKQWYIYIIIKINKATYKFLLFCGSMWGNFQWCYFRLQCIIFFLKFQQSWPHSCLILWGKKVDYH